MSPVDGLPPTPPESIPSPDDHSRVHIHVDLAPGTRLHILVQSQRLDGTPLESETYTYGPQAQPAIIPAPKSRLPSQLKLRFMAFIQRQNWTLAGALFSAAALVYLLTRLIGLMRFPIYFFSDEAVQTVLASDFIRDGLHNYAKDFLPTYFENMYQYNLGVSVYAQVLPLLEFGKSIFVTRATSVLLTMVGAISVGFTMRNIFKSRLAWAAVLILSITPAWFLHSRTAFETAEATAFYAGFIYFYLKYRTDQPKALFAAIALGALAYYTYSPMRMIIAVTALLLFLVDLPYHWQQRKILLIGLGLLLVLAIPMLRFQFVHPQENLRHLTQLSSYWVTDISLTQKLAIYFNNYLAGLNPIYWYAPNNTDLARHIMLGYGHLFRLGLPFTLLGLILCVLRIRKPQYRTLLIALLAAPTGEALVGLGITRILAMVIPATLITAVGLSEAVAWAERTWKGLKPFLVPALFILLVGYNFYMLADVLKNGPTWYTDYGLGGMQYGGQQVSTAIREELRQQPNTHIILSPSWANGADILMRFYFQDPAPFEVGSIEGYLNVKLPLTDQTLFIMIPEEYHQISNNGKFTDVRVEKTLPSPNGQPGFYFVRLRYSDQIDQILAAEKAQRLILQKDTLQIAGVQTQVSYSYLDMGDITKIFDGDPATLIRTMEANPLQVIMDFSKPVQLSGLAAQVGGPATQLNITALLDNGETRTFNTTAKETAMPRRLDVDFGGPLSITRLSVNVLNINDAEPAHIHLWELILKQP